MQKWGFSCRKFRPYKIYVLLSSGTNTGRSGSLERLGWLGLVWFYGISIIVGYLSKSSLYIYIRCT